jgi:hypothetical protein
MEGFVFMEGERPLQDTVVLWLDATDKRIQAMEKRLDSGEEISDAERIEILTGAYRMLRDTLVNLAYLIDTSR